MLSCYGQPVVTVQISNYLMLRYCFPHSLIYICKYNHEPLSSSTKITTMSTYTRIIVLPTIIIAIGSIHLRYASATANESTSGNEKGDDEREKYLMIKDLVLAWIEKPPYVISLTNESLGGEVHGMLREALLRYIANMECSIFGRVIHLINPVRADSEFHMIELLRQNEVHVAAPIFEPTERRYKEFSFFKL